MVDHVGNPFRQKQRGKQASRPRISGPVHRTWFSLLLLLIIEGDGGLMLLMIVYNG